MKNDVQPFEQLTPQEQGIAVDLAVAASLIVTRLPQLSEQVFHAIENEFALQCEVSPNVARYAMRTVGRTLFNVAWECQITKDLENNLATHFKQISTGESNGDSAP